MKIEKINDNQIKLTLTRADLTERNIKFEELIKPSEKTQELFKSIMEQVLDECGFSFENTPLMVEATPVPVDGIMIIVTKLPEKTTPEDKLSFVTQNKDLRRYKKKELLSYIPAQGTDEGICIFSFDDLNTVSNVSLRLNTVFNGYSSLYKYDKKYFLIMQNDATGTEMLDLILNEYGQKHVSNVLSKYHLSEYGELIIGSNAIDKMSKL